MADDGELDLDAIQAPAPTANTPAPECINNSSNQPAAPAPKPNNTSYPHYAANTKPIEPDGDIVIRFDQRPELKRKPTLENDIQLDVEDCNKH